MSHNVEALKAHILPMSRGITFEAARQEWVLAYVEVSDEWDSCPCGQDIKEHCYIQNTVTCHQTYVGNVCVNKFLGIDTGNLFDGLKRLKANPKANPNHAVVDYAEARGYIYPSESKFLRENVLTRKFSVKQMDWKLKITRRILNQTVVQRRTVR